MSTETKEEIKAAHELRDEKIMTQKIRAAMLEIPKLEKPEEDYPFYEHVMENFSKGEMAHVVCLYVAKEMARHIQESPEFLLALQALNFMNKFKKEKDDK